MGTNKDTSMKIIQFVLVLLILTGLGIALYDKGKQDVLNQLSTHGHYYYNNKYLLCAIKEEKDLLTYKFKLTKEK